MKKTLKLGALSVVLAASGCSVDSGKSDAPPSEELDQTSQAVSDVCPSPYVSGIDIASFQHPNGAAIDFTKVATKEKFVIVKATEKNNYKNPYYADDLVKARAAGLIVGSYHFLAPSSQTGVSGASQAAYFLAHSSYKAGDLPPMLDVETSSQYGSVLPSATDVKGWLSAVETALGRKPIVYIGYFTLGDLGTPASLKSYPINIPSYGSCPSFPDSYPIANLIMWQHTSTASITGISGGGVDEDRFYGNMAAFNSFVTPPSSSPGSLDEADCDGVAGWAWNASSPDKPSDVDLSFDGKAGDADVTTLTVTADQSRMDLCDSIGSCDHAYSMRAPRSLYDGSTHSVHAYLSTNDAAGTELASSPRSLQCPSLTIPAGTVERQIVDSSAFGAWKFDAFTDVAPVLPSDIDGAPRGADLASAPVCVKADDGSPEVWIIDQGMRRHVVDQSVLAAWRLSVASMPAAQVYANGVGPDWPKTPDLVRAPGGDIYFLDAPISAGGPSASTGAGGGAPPSVSSASADSGCAIARASGSGPNPVPWLALVGMLAAGLRSRGKERAMEALRNVGKAR